MAELSFPTAGSGPARPVIDDSERIEAAFTFSRPMLSMRVTGFSVSRDEYGSAVSWQLQLAAARSRKSREFSSDKGGMVGHGFRYVASIETAV